MDLTYDRVSGALGSLLLLWAAIERSTRDEIVRVYGSLPQEAHGIAGMLRAWEGMVVAVQPAASLCPLLATTLHSQLKEPLQIRNGLCHGLIGISVPSEETPVALRWEFKGKQHSITWEDLQALLYRLSKVPHALSIISNPSLERIGSRGLDSAENLNWWRMEFGLDLRDRD